MVGNKAIGKTPTVKPVFLISSDVLKLTCLLPGGNCGHLCPASLSVTSHLVQFSHSVVSDSLWPHGLQYARLPRPSLSAGYCSFMSIESVMPYKNLILCHPLLLLPSIFPSIRVFCNGSAVYIRWPRYWSFSISPSNEYSGLISIRIDSLDLLAVQELTSVFFKTTVQKHQFFGAQPSLWFSTHIHTWLLEKPQLWLDRPLSAK